MLIEVATVVATEQVATEQVAEVIIEVLIET